MAKKHMKRCSTSYVFGNRKLKHDTPITTAKTQNTDSTKFWQGCGATGTLRGWWNVKWRHHFGREFGGFLQKKTILLSCGRMIILLCIYSNPSRTYIHPKTCTKMCITLFIHKCQTSEATKMSFVR